MALGLETDSAASFVGFVEKVRGILRDAVRARHMGEYCTGLLAAPGRKSVEPMAAVTAPSEVSIQHQKLLHFIANAPWSDEKVMTKARELVLPAIERPGPLEPGIIHATSCPTA